MNSMRKHLWDEVHHAVPYQVAELLTSPVSGATTTPTISMPAPELPDQAVALPRFQVIVAFTTLSSVFFISTLDQTCVATALPKIARDLDAAHSITWVGTSFLICSTITQVITTRLSDIFGRKALIQCSLAVFAAGNLLSGFAQNAAWLYAGRGVAGLGAGGISSLGLVVISDVVSLRDRGLYTSLMGVPVAVGLAIGPVIGGAPVDHSTWRWALWLTVPPSVVAMPIITWFLPLKAVPGDMRSKIKSVDWGGSFLSLGAITLLLIPISAGGVSWSWSSPTSVSLLVVGSVLLVAFIVAEYYHPLAILPLRLFRNPTVTLVMISLFCVGILWFGNQFIAPLYLQNVLGYSATTAGALLLPLLVGQTIVMTALGYAMRKWGKSKIFILAGYLIFTAGQGMQVAWSERKDLGLIIGAFTLQGIGFGLTSQSTLVLAQASCDAADRAVITGARNLFRTSGGAVGLAVSTAIINAVFQRKLPSDLPPAVADQLKSTGFDVTLVPDAQRAGVIHAYYLGLRAVFILYVPVIFCCFLFLLGVEDVTLAPGPKPPQQSEVIEMEEEQQPDPTEAATQASDGGKAETLSEDTKPVTTPVTDPAAPANASSVRVTRQSSRRRVGRPIQSEL